MSVIVLDTDVSSAVLRDRLSGPLTAKLANPTLANHTLAVTFVTVGELAKWRGIRSWGPQRSKAFSLFLGRVVVLSYSVAVAQTCDFAEHDGLELLTS